LHPLALQDLDRALLEFLTRELIALASQGQPVHPAMVETCNILLAAPVVEDLSAR
jgi:HD superfamily phosphohydrolase YqeK